jgi:pimeloyl-ACP methyl ester carboxylesterase
VRFVLVHGAHHGAWCWDRLIPELEALGHAGLPVELPGGGRRANEVASLDSWRDAIAEVLQDDDVLVGHSVGGWAVTVAANAVPDMLRHVVYFAGGLPFEGHSIAECIAGLDSKEISQVHAAVSNADGDSHIEYSDDGSTMRIANFEAAREYFFHDCTPEDAAWAFERLTPQQTAPILEPISVPRFWAADLPRSFILCLQDRTQPRWLADQTAARLGVEPLAIDSSHSPFLSQPRKLAELFVAAVGTTPVGPLRQGGD